ncbi:expressed unknown protein [Seminavis robusta]|uniref:Uncharacterized protein n=1 Tax=Seminavis robusta TaxID=568900 RepID=A0A9N8HE33_9STRA|nr:expressed unknown protein [Seminavis robusta]|eukprot:Sro493_g154090.1 n/a (325) ;mRNA; f:31383-32357
MERSSASKNIRNSNSDMEPQAKKAKTDNTVSLTEETKEGADDEQRQPSWLPKGCSVVRVPVLGKEGLKKLFAFPATLVYDNLACLLGLKLNPWTADSTSGCESQPCHGGCLEVESNALVDLQITDQMCCAYVYFCRMGFVEGIFTDLSEFLLRLAAPDELMQRYQLDVGKSNIKFAVRSYIQSLGRHDYGQHTDVVGFFAEWIWPIDRVPFDAILIPLTDRPPYPSKKFVRLHQTPEQTEALQKRLQREVWKLDAVQNAMQSGRGRNSDTIESLRHYVIGLMMEERLPYYNIPILEAVGEPKQEDEEEAGDGTTVSNARKNEDG